VWSRIDRKPPVDVIFKAVSGFGDDVELLGMVHINIFKDIRIEINFMYKQADVILNVTV
jgi:hypothetical protein